MEIETINNQNVFSRVKQDHLCEFKTSDVICQLQVSFQKFHAHTHKLLLTKNYILLTEIHLSGYPSQQTPKIYAAKLSFQLKFQIQVAQQVQMHDQKIGITLFHNQQEQNTFYTFHGTALQIMRSHLGRYLNQRGFHNQFKPVKKLGKGNFASVYQVIRVSDGKKFAVKAFSKANTYNSQNGKESLINQLTIMRQLSHQSKNILSLEAVYESDNSIYIVLQLLEGKNLYEVLKQRNGNFSLNQIRTILKGLLRGVKCMNEKKIMHRDLKPENIMFRYQNMSQLDAYEPVIVDFGLAAQSDIVPYLFFRCGTPGFVAPQIIKIQQNSPYSPACDIFSIGCIFHLLMTSNAVFPGTKYEDVYKKNKLLEFDIKTHKINNLSPYALNILQRMLDSSPQTRLTAAQALNNAFFYEIKPIQNIKMDQDEVVTNYPISPSSCGGRININY